MRTTTLVLFTLGAALASGCMISAQDCDSPREAFAIDVALTEGDVAAISEEWQVRERTQITCEQACQFAYGRARGWEVGPLSSCAWLVDAEPGATPDEVVASVACAGDGYEFLCEF